MAEKYYNVHAQSFFENTFHITMNDVYERFEHYLPKNGSILDIGCGSGRDVLYFREKGYNVIGIDVSERLAELAREQTKCDIRLLDVRDLDFASEFDGLWACASLLHLKRDILPGVMKRCLDALKRDGIMYLSFKYGSSEGVRRERYFTDMNEELLDDLLGYVPGFKKIQIWQSHDKRPDRKRNMWLNGILKKQNEDTIHQSGHV